MTDDYLTTILVKTADRERRSAAEQHRRRRLARQQPTPKRRDTGEGCRG